MNLNWGAILRVVIMKGVGQEVEGQGKGNNMKTNSERNNNPF